jgi:peptidoglycan-associated lipoprotein
MNSRILATVAIAAALATAGCNRRAPEVLPPSAGDTTGGGLGVDGGGGSGAVVAGSRADFLQSVPADRVFFALDSHTLTAEARAVLDAQAQWLNTHSTVRITIEGHCDERGTREYNLALGERRANAVASYLEARGVSPTRIQTISWGKERPEAFGTDETSYSRNRRAVTVVPEA